MSTPEFNPHDQRTKVDPTDLPPLEPTAEVPAVHSDKLNDPAYWAEKYEGRTARVPREHRDDKHEKKAGFWTRGKVLVAGGVAVAAAAAAGIGLTQGGDNNTEPRQEPGASAPATPGTNETPAPSETAPSDPETDAPVGAVELSAEEYTNGEQLSRGFVEQTNNWVMAGATPELVENRDRSMSVDEYVQSVAGPIDEAYINALIVPGWENDESLRTFVEQVRNSHRIFLKAYIGTMLSGTGEPYKYYASITSAAEESATPEQIVGSYRYVGHDNFDKNNAHEYITDSQEGTTGGSTVTWVNKDGSWKAADVEYNAD